MTSDSSLKLSIKGMSCASCVGRVEKALRAVPGVDGAAVNLASESAQLQITSAADVAAITAALDKAGYPARTGQVTLLVENMSCASCVGRVEKALAGVPGVLEARVNLARETALVRYLEGEVTPEVLMRAAQGAGYPARVKDAAEPEDQTARKDAEARKIARTLVIAALLAAPVFVLEMGGHVIPGFQQWINASIGREASWLIQFALTTAVLIWPGRRFYLKGYPALLRGAPDMNSLVALGTSAAYGYSVVATFAPSLLPAASRVVYYESASRSAPAPISRSRAPMWC